ncbi:MAG: FG-GAP-like repeat-containing protein, partial [Verrucomicrobiota bacterium]
AIGDLVGDDLPEVFLASGPGRNRLYRQKAPFVFEDVTGGLDGGEDWASGVAFADIDGDGDLDVYVCNYNTANALFLNESAGDGTSLPVFREAASAFGLDVVNASLMPSFCDYDNDGDLDCFILTNRLYREGGRPQQPPFYKENGQVKVKPEFADYYGITRSGEKSYRMDDIGRPDVLLRNDGGTFVDVSEEAGIALNGFGLSAVWWDYNEDGLMDIYVCNDFSDPDRLFRNDGDGSFTDVIKDTVNVIPWFSMGSDAGDINNDGRLDLIAVDMSATTHYKSKMAMGDMGSRRWEIEFVKPRQLMRNVCFLNTGVPRFLETAQLSGIDSTDWSWAAKLADFDGDGRVDLFVSNGMTRDFNNSDIPFDDSMLIGKTQWDHYEHTPTVPEQNLAFRNLDGLTFKDTSKSWGLDHTGMSFGTAYGDLDRDGDLDLMVVNLDEPVSVYRNESTGHHRIVVRLEGGRKNTYGLGARVLVETASGKQHLRQVMPMTGYQSSNVPELVIGLGDDSEIRRLTVSWPSGIRQVFDNLEADKRFVIRETGDEPSMKPDAAADQPLFVRSKVLEGLVHREKPYEDFSRQLLLPNKLSQLGPGMAWGDVDGDGDEDLYVSAASGMGGAVLVNEGPGADGVCRFSNPSTAPFLQDARRENMGALFFDVDRDGDEDLYVANGSYEFGENDALLQDRLYLNDGRGRFARAAAGALPEFRDASSCVVGADVDRDGDVDLFVGGRVIPGRYPEAASSRLLINQSQEGGGAVRLVEAAPSMAKGLRSAGLVTGALWSDADNDGWVDLFVTLEWGPVKYFHNEEGTLVEKTREAGLSERTGWWNGISGADVDGDGDMDYAVSNFGLNTKYKASPKKPSLLYYGDYAGDGTKSLIEAKYEKDVLRPVRGKSCSTHAMPHLAGRFKTYDQFARAALPEIYAPDQLEKSLSLAATALESGLLINDGSGRFQFRAFPAMAQLSPCFGLSFLDADADGAIDLFLAQNFFTPQFETGPFAGGLSVLLHGDGKGNFKALPPEKSGLFLEGDAKASAVVDLNGDGRVELAVAQNDGPFRIFENVASAEKRFLRVRLVGRKGNVRAAGARVTGHRASGAEQVQEIRAGEGYLSQSSMVPVFAQRPGDPVVKVTVRWPDGKVSQPVDLPAGQDEVTLAW